jgi:hypothetical protein
MLSIQKQVLLLSEFHYQEFIEYLKSSNAELSYKLITTIKKQKKQPDSDGLCKLIYGDSAEKTRKKFLQLTHHTFKLSGFLSRNYPNYLKHNLQIVEELLSKGQKQQANYIAEWLIDVAEKIEDYTTLIEVYKFKAQQAFITESKDTIKNYKKVDDYIELEQIKNSIYYYLREHASFKGKESVSKSKLNKDLAFFDKYVHHKSNSINILARFGKYYELSFLNHPDFFKKETLKQLDVLEKDFLNNAYVCFHALDDVYYKILGLKLQHDMYSTNTSAMLSEIKKMNGVSSFLKFWKSYVNIPELFAMAAQINHYTGAYGYIFRSDYNRRLNKEVKESLVFLKNKLEELLEKDIWSDGHLVKYIKVKCFYAIILLSGDDKDKDKAIKTLEDTLISYQQIPFQNFLDRIFVTLVMGYFSLNQHDKVIASYKRYKKITAKQIVQQENDLTIEAYYFTTQYLTSQRKQYIDKLEATHRLAKHHASVRLLIEELDTYYKLPVTLN